MAIGMALIDREGGWVKNKNASKNSDDRFQTALLVSSSRMDDLAKGLEKAWIAQLLLAAIGVALILNIGEFRCALANYFSQGSPSLKVPAGVILLAALYFFMRFGHLLSAFLRSRKLHERLVEEFQRSRGFRSNLGAFKQSFSYFEGYYSTELFGNQRPVKFMYFMVTAFGLSISQASSIYLIYLAYGLGPFPAVLIFVVGLGLLFLYVGFWRAKRDDFPHTPKFVFFCIFMVIVLLVAFHFAPLWLSVNSVHEGISHCKRV